MTTTLFDAGTDLSILAPPPSPSEGPRSLAVGTARLT